MLGMVTVTYNSGDVLPDFLRATTGQTFQDFRLFIIDNDSRDVTRELLARVDDPRIVVTLNDKNLGVAEANNQGILGALESGCDRILLINNDTDFPADTLEKLVDMVESHGVKALAPLVYFHDNPLKPWFSGGIFVRWRAFRNTHHLPPMKAEAGQGSSLRLIEYAPTCCLLLDRCVFTQVGLMDPTYFVYSDDTDFCWRMLKAKVPLWYTEEAHIYHKASSLTGGSESAFSLRFMMRNRVLFIRKHTSFLQKMWSFLYLQTEIFYKLIFIARNMKTFRIQQQAFVEGLQMVLVDDSDLVCPPRHP